MAPGRRFCASKPGSPVALVVAVSIGADRPRRGAPADAIFDHLEDIGVVVGGIGLVSGAEVEDPAGAALPGDAAAEDLSAGEPAREDNILGGGDVEVLAVHLLGVDDELVVDPFGNGVIRAGDPEDLPVIRL